jgi:hypothetical protein
MRKFFHVSAIMLSSLVSMVTHGKAQDTAATGATGKDKKGESALAKHHRHHTGATKASDLASQDPPRKRSLASDDSDGAVKHSRHAAVWSSSMAQESTPALKLDPSLMASAERTSEIVPGAQIAPPPLPGDAESRYPWKRQIVTTTFWVGESPTHNNPVPNTSSCWDPNWAKNYGGNDPEDCGERTANYIPATFTPAQNPFYIALPYNDMEHGVHKAEASQIIPWFAKDYKGPGRSVCQGRWIAIRFGAKVCYAQWEDAGPFRTDHWQYVFGNDRPRPNLNRGAGLDVSPAVRDFLGMNGTDVTDWKFVDFDEVPTGPWARYGDNNTFVQNARKTGGAVVDLTPSANPLDLRHILPTVELR